MESTQCKKTALNSVHHAAGAKMVPYAGFEMPVQYSGVNQEHMAVREHLGVFDVSHMGQFYFRGEQAEELLQRLVTNDVSKIKIGQAQYSAMTNEKGGIIDDLILYRMADNEYMMVVNAGCLDKDWEWVNKHNDLGVEITNDSDSIALLAIQGPKSIEAMQALTDVNLSEIKFYHFEKGTFAGVQDVIISATGYTGSGGFEIYFPADDAETMWNAVMQAGKEYGMIPCGLASRDTLRLEKGYCLYGNDINQETSPLEAGLGWVTKFNNEFIGSDVLKKQKEDGVERKLVGFRMIDRGIPRNGYKITDVEGNEIGEVTSGTQSPMLKEGIGLGYVKIGHDKPQSPIFIRIRDKQVKAEIAKVPFV